MCSPAVPARPAGSRAALEGVLTGLSWLCQARTSEMPAAELAACLRILERAESLLTAARSDVLRAFIAQDGCADDGHGSARTWLTWQAKVTRAAAAGAVGWVRRLEAHPEVGAALAAGEISASWARQVCDWTDKIPADRRPDADVILTGAAAGGADLAGLAALAEEIYRRCAGPDRDEDGFADRSLRLDRTLGGAGRLSGDLTPRCAAALSAVLEALGAKAGPEDDRTRDQRDHDALEEACRRLLGARCLPDRAGQPAQIRLHMSLEQLRGLAGAPQAEAGWAEQAAQSSDTTRAAAAALAAAAGLAAASPGDACDAEVAPQVDGHVDPSALTQLTRAWQHACNHAAWTDVGGTGTGGAGTGSPGTGSPGTGSPGTGSAGSGAALTRGRLQRSMLRLAADALSGPGGLAGYLRTELLSGPAAAPSLPLDLGASTPVIPAHLRRAVASRDTRCAFPGCDTPPAACQVHHLVPRSDGGNTSLANLILLCSFHHLIAVHRWGWTLILHPDATVTATSPDGTRTLQTHGPPSATVA